MNSRNTNIESEYEDVADIYCTDKDQTIVGEILNFVPGKFLTVSLDRSVKINLNYNEDHDIYIGSLAGLEFQSKGPSKSKY